MPRFHHFDRLKMLNIIDGGVSRRVACFRPSNVSNLFLFRLRGRAAPDSFIFIAMTGNFFSSRLGVLSSSMLDARRAALQRGFSLIEIMVVVVIMGVLAALVVPNVMDRPDQARVVAAKQ